MDDVCCVGDKGAIDDAISKIKGKWNIKDVGKMQEYVGCTVKRDLQKNLVELSQFGLIKKMEDNFGNDIKSLKDLATLAANGQIVICPKDDLELISKEDQTKYRSGVGMLLYLVKHSRPEISNAVRELAKVMDGASLAHVKYLLRAIKYVIDTKDHVLAMKPHLSEFGVWNLVAFSDSDYSGDKDTRLSVTGFIVYLNNVPISWKSRGQKNITLSSTEAEYVAMSEVVAEIMFCKQIIEFLDVKVTYPIIVRVDNVGAIFLSNNASLSQRTKHIDVRYHFVREFVEDGVIKIVFVKSAENDADLYTKNLGEVMFAKHASKYVRKSEID